MILRILSLLALAAMASCAPSQDGTDGGPDIVQSLAEAPPGAPTGTCWGKVVTPAVIETITDQIMVQPPEIDTDGTVRRQGVFRTETRQEIVLERQVTWFETPCAADLGPDFIASLQRALKARDVYRGAITGKVDDRTRAAVRQYQQKDGLDSGILSLASARKLGLVAVELPGAG